MTQPATAAPDAADDDTPLTRDGYDAFMLQLQAAMFERGEWAGVPAPVRGLSIVLEPRWPYQDIADICKEEDLDAPDLAAKRIASEEDAKHLKLRNQFESVRGVHVFICDDDRTPGKVTYGLEPNSTGTRIDLMVKTIGASSGWDMEAEMQAQIKLCDHLTENQRRLYFLTSSFLESSKRSGVMYLFRRSRPTIALKAVKGNMKILATLCMHPIGYYRDTFAGVMVPSDEVLAHLLLMRGCEERFWRYANQHDAKSPRSGV